MLPHRVGKDCAKEFTIYANRYISAKMAVMPLSLLR